MIVPGKKMQDKKEAQNRRNRWAIKKVTLGPTLQEVLAVLQIFVIHVSIR